LSHGNVLRLPMFESFVGLVLGDRYEIQDLLGSGGTAFVYAARDRKLDRQVAVKFVKPEYAWSPEVIDALVEEARIIAKLEHPNILSVYDQGTQTIEGQRLVYLVMQFAGGDSLKKRVETTEALPLNEAERVFKQVCAALDYAHNHGVIHLDLKPANILFDKSDNVLVADFGFARLLRGMSRVKAQTGFGTLAYMPLEQFAGGDAGSFSDVYALGITLYHILTGELPQREFTEEGLLVYLTQPLQPGIRAVIERATQSDPSKRYHTAGELARAFTAAIALPAPSGRDTEEAAHAEVEKPAKDRAGKRRISFGVLSKHGRQMVAAASVFVALTSCVAAVIVVPEVRHMLGLEPSTTPSVPTVESQTATPTATPTLVPFPTDTPTLAPSPTPCLVVSVERLCVYAGPGEIYDMWGEIRRGDQLRLRGRLEDGTWWQVDYLGRNGWIRAQPVGANVEPTVLPIAEAPPAPTITPTPTQAATPTLLAPNTMLSLQNPRFERVRENLIPGWRWWAADNYPDEEYDAQRSFDAPFFSQTNDPARMIHGATLQIEATAFVNFRVHVFQTVSALPSVAVRFQAAASAYSNVGGIKLAAGIDPDGGPDCSQARWGDTLTIDQSSGAVQLVAPIVVVGRDGQVTVCLRAENILPARSNAAYFDDAALIANPE
jgi:serine/threonine protein kinase